MKLMKKQSTKKSRTAVLQCGLINIIGDGFDKRRNLMSLFSAFLEENPLNEI